MLPALFLPSNIFWDAFCAFSASFVVLSQQFHSWCAQSRAQKEPSHFFHFPITQAPPKEKLSNQVFLKNTYMWIIASRSHSRKEQLPEIVTRLQDWGVLISRRQHAQHHCAPFENNYCIVSGWWNGPLDSSGVFTWIEKLIYRLTGKYRNYKDKAIRAE